MTCACVQVVLSCLATLKRQQGLYMLGVCVPLELC